MPNSTRVTRIQLQNKKEYQKIKGSTKNNDTNWRLQLGNNFWSWVRRQGSQFFYLETKLKTTQIMVDDTFEGFVMPRKPTAHQPSTGLFSGGLCSTQVHKAITITQVDKYNVRMSQIQIKVEQSYVLRCLLLIILGCPC